VSAEIARLVADGLSHLRAGRLDEAESAARTALVLAPDDPDALHLNGVVLWRLNRPVEAAGLLARAVVMAPQNAELRKNLGIALFELRHLDEAIARFREATILQPQMAAAHYHLATALREKGEIASAINVLRRVLALEPDNSEAANDLAAALKDRGRLGDAIAMFRTIVAKHPTDSLAWTNLARCLLDHGDARGATEAFDRVLEIKPQSPAARFGKCMACLPLGYRSETEIAESRAAYASELDALCRHYATAPAEERFAAAEPAAHTLPFYLAYHGQDDRALQDRFGGLLAQLHHTRYLQWSERPAMPPRDPDGRLRIGVVSGFFRTHSVWKLFGGWVRHLDRGSFRVIGYSTSQKRDSETEQARAAFDEFVDAPLPFEGLAFRIRADAPHALIYPEIGMDPLTARLATLRLAPLQCVAWGHPDTTGLPTIDAFLSSDLMEPAEADAFYTERLVRLPNLSIHYAPLEVAPQPPDLAAAGVRPDAVKYLCCQSLYKYRPMHDDIYPRIAGAVPQAQFLFIEHPLSAALTSLTRERLTAAFTRHGLDAERHLVFVPPQSSPLYAGLNAACDIYLDSLDWSGGNTTLEAVAAGLPVVTQSGEFLRGRHSLAILRRMGIEDTIARDKDAYVAIAARLGNDLAWRAQQARLIVDHRHRLYNDTAPVAALEKFLLESLQA
jgi:protein O-GlcNAc transferase